MDDDTKLTEAVKELTDELNAATSVTGGTRAALWDLYSTVKRKLGW